MPPVCGEAVAFGQIPGYRHILCGVGRDVGGAHSMNSGLKKIKPKSILKEEPLLICIISIINNSGRLLLVMGAGDAKAEINLSGTLT